MKIEKVPSGLAAGGLARAVTAIRSPGSTQGLWIEAGVIRLFGKGDIANRGLVSGWAAPEEGHNWNDGIEAVVALEATPPTVQVTIVAEGVPYIFSNADRQEITLYANGFRVGYWRLTERKLSTLTARIEPEHWFNRKGTGHLCLTWHLPGSMRPTDLGDGADGRILGFAFRTICMTEGKDD